MTDTGSIIDRRDALLGMALGICDPLGGARRLLAVMSEADLTPST